MKNIVIWGYAIEGVNCYRKVVANSAIYEFIGFADNSPLKQHKIVNGKEIYSLGDLKELNTKVQFSVIIASHAWREIGKQLQNAAIEIEGIYENGSIREYGEMTFEKLDFSKEIKLYAGDIFDEVHMKDLNLYGLSINKSDSRHILHDITNKYPLPDNSISHYQAEDVLEHIDVQNIVSVINEIYRILKQGALFRICLPDYYSSYLKDISMKDREGNIIFDPTGGGIYGDGVENGGHVWFPNYDNVNWILKQTKFNNIEFLCYHTKDGELILKDIDFSKGYISRVFQKNKADIYSMVIDCYK